MDGFLNLLKPSGPTSQAALQRVRRGFPGRVKAGHLGTLDPLAEGVLPIAIGNATRLLPYANLEPKVYRFELTFGIETDTFDAEGKVVAERPAITTGAELLTVLPQFVGNIMQTPPAFSALQQGGQRLYDLARKGLAPSPQPRRITIHSLEMLSFESGPPPRGIFLVRCSGGTYVRSLGADLGRAAGCGAHVSALTRLQAGVFRIEEGVPLETAERSPKDFILPVDFPVSHLLSVALTEEQAVQVSRGSAISAAGTETGGWVRLYTQGRLLAIAGLSEGQLRPKVVLTNG